MAHRSTPVLSSQLEETSALRLGGSRVLSSRSRSPAAKVASIGEYPVRHRAFRFGYAVYRQIARRRYSETAETRSFKALCRLLRIRSSTVEPSKNFPDLFMTSEVLDCLSQSGIWGNSHETGIT